MEYMFSVVMAVYNVEPFIREAVDSLIAQDIGFENVQLILADDGSTDGSSQICDVYAANYGNISVIHKKNGGVSSARNAGIPYATGRYISFMDSDDRLTPDTLSLVWRFFEAHREETDVVSVPIVFFDGKTGDHVLNYKFNTESRVIDLEKEWSCVQLHGSSSFIRAEALEGLRFDTGLHYGEDAKLMQRLLVKKKTLGVVPLGRYMYRRRIEGESSALQKSAQDPFNYVPKMKLLIQDTIEYCKREIGTVPKFIQFALMYDLQWVITKNDLPSCLSDEERAEYLTGMVSVLKDIDDEVILAQKNIKIEQKLFVLGMKYGCSPEQRPVDGDVELCYDGKKIYSVSTRKPTIDFIRFENGMCVVEGTFSLFPLRDVTPEIIAELDGKDYPCELFYDSNPVLSLGEIILIFYRFRVAFPAPEQGSRRFRVCMKLCGHRVRPTAYTYGAFSGLSENYASSYYIHDKWRVRHDDGLLIDRIGPFTRAGSDLRFTWELLTSRKHHAKRAVLYRMACRFLRFWRRKPLWLICDRAFRAGDNGEAFFRYMVTEHPEIDARFILLEDSPDYPALSRIGKVIPADSLKRKLLGLSSDYTVSSQADQHESRPFAPKDDAFRDLMADYRFVYLKHGIIKDDLSQWLRKPKKNIRGFITAARPEYESIISGRYGYTNKEVWLTGLPRFDRLNPGKDPRQITIMPTWRKYLMGQLDERTGVWSIGPQFLSSRFLTFYNALINDERLIRAAEQFGYSLAFLPHPFLQPYLSVFQNNDSVSFLGPETAYRDVFASSSLVVTDYSSTVFDFVYLRRPVVYAQFDREEFFGGAHSYTEGYFDYERDGFGEVEHDLEHTVDRIIEYMACGCKMKDNYRARADRFFMFDDRNNCQRVYEKLMENGARSR